MMDYTKAASETDRKIEGCSILSSMEIMFPKMEEVSLGSHAAEKKMNLFKKRRATTDVDRVLR